MIKNRKKIKLFITFIFLFQKIIISMGEINSISSGADRDDNYKKIICYNRRRNNVINTILLFGLAGSAYLIVKKSNQKILKGEDFSGWLQFLNQRKNIVFKIGTITKNIVLPALSYGLLFNMRKKQRWTDFCEQYFGKSIMQDNFIKDINKDIKNVDVRKKNIFEGSVASSLMYYSDVLREIVYGLRDGIEISNRKIISILNGCGITGEKDSSNRRLFFGLQPYFYYSQDKAYYEWATSFENRVIEYSKNSGQKNDAQKKENEAQKKLFEIQKILENKYNKSFWINFLLLITVKSLFIVLMYKIYLNMNYIEAYGLEDNCIINFLRKMNIPCEYIGEIVANGDWVYWFHQFFLYVLLPTSICLLTNKFNNYRIENNLLKSVNYLFIDNHNLLVNKNNNDAFNDILAEIQQYEKNIKNKELKDFFNFIQNNFKDQTIKGR